MRTLSSSLLAAQKKLHVKPLAKIVLTHGATTYTYTKARILDATETEDGSLQSCEVVLANGDRELTDIDLRGFKGIISFGLVTLSAEEYSDCAPMWATAQRFDSTQGKLTCTLTLAGIIKLMNDDRASDSYIPDEDDTKSIKTLVNELIGATMACFNHCTPYEVVWDAGYDTLADTYKPKDGFRIYTNGSRRAALDRLLQYTKNVAVAKNDGKVHILKPVTSGTTYDYEYTLEDGHVFFAKALRNRLVIPNYVVVKSRDDDDPQYSGSAQDAESYALLPRKEFRQTSLESNQQGTDIAEAILAKAQMWCESGSASVPMNVGAEVFDYAKVTDRRESDYRAGNIGMIVRHYQPAKMDWRMTMVFGNWQSVRKALTNLSIDPDDLQDSFSRLRVGDLYAEHILADSLDMVWIDPEGNIDLSLIGDNLDNLPDGEIYARVKSLHLDAEGGIKLDENIIYKAGYDPSTKWTGSNLDDLPDGLTYQRVKSVAINTNGMVILDQVVAGTYGLLRATCINSGYIELNTLTRSSGEWYDKSGVVIDSSKGICIYGKDMALYTSNAKWGTVQCKVDSTGQIIAGAGDVKLNSAGIQIMEDALAFYYGGSWVTPALAVGVNSSGGIIQAFGRSLYIVVPSSYVFNLSAPNIGIGAAYLTLGNMNYIGLPVYDDSGGHPVGFQGKAYVSSATGELHLYTNVGAGLKWYRCDLTPE
jgi:hypothetical protein